MKLFSKSFFLIIALIFISATCLAKEGPPPPATPATPPGLPVDDNIYILLFFALVLGFYKVYQFKHHKKTPN